MHNIRNQLLSVETGKALLQSRSEIEDKYKWNLTDIYANDEQWETDFNWVIGQIPEYKKYEGRLADSSSTLLACLRLDDSVGMKLERLYLYSMLSKDSDLRDNKYQAMDDRIKSLYSKITATSSFIKPELLSIPDEKLLKMISANEELKIYKHLIDDLLRTKAHTLSNKEEKILALAGEITQAPYSAYSMFTNADLKFPIIKDDDGNDVELSHARFYAAMYSGDREYRNSAFSGYLNTYKDYVNTFSSLFNSNLKTNIFNARSRNYTSAREASLDKNNIPISVYDKLVEAVNKNFGPMHRWAALKKKLLKLDELCPYDVYVTVFNQENEKKYPYEEAIELVLKSLEIMGSDYQESLRKAFGNRWIDVYETQAKKSGAYSSGTTFGVLYYSYS